uniref:Uncharacterized protein n=1 Tax=Ralstonia solanacearum TaxID=305 RepID=A0A0S4TU00_RALSL|nr:protein of unknown function [Ralstonia solanacearum]
MLGLLLPVFRLRTYFGFSKCFNHAILWMKPAKASWRLSRQQAKMVKIRRMSFGTKT